MCCSEKKKKEKINKIQILREEASHIIVYGVAPDQRIVAQSLKPFNRNVSFS